MGYELSKMVFEGLEERRLMAGGGPIPGPTPPPPPPPPLVINGTSGHDVIKLAQVGLYTQVTQNGYVSNYPSYQMGAISIYGKEGSDLIDCSGMGAHKVYIEGGAGYDTIKGGAGHDTIYGAVPPVGGQYGSADSDQDTIEGGDGNDVIYVAHNSWMPKSNGGTGNDTIYGSYAHDTIMGGTGNDEIYAGSGYNWIDAGADNDYIAAAWHNDTVYGGIGDDTILTEEGDDQVWGGPPPEQRWSFVGDGKDYISAGNGNNRVDGDSGDDIIFSGHGTDSLWGGSGNDQIYQGEGNSQVYGDAGNDTLLTTGGADLVYGGWGDDQINVGGGNDTVYAEAGNDSIDGGARSDWIEGGAGNDTIKGGPGPALYDSDQDLLSGGDGIDLVSYEGHFSRVTVRLNGSWGNGSPSDGMLLAEENDFVAADFEGAAGGAGDDVIYGSGLPNALSGNQGKDTIYGSWGDDTMDGGAGEDVLYGEYGNDQISGGNDPDWLYGGFDNDALDGGGGADLLYGQDGSDDLSGGSEADRLYGGHDNDTLDGGFGEDVLVSLGGGSDQVLGGATGAGEDGDYFWAGTEDAIVSDPSVQHWAKKQVIPSFANQASLEPDGQNCPDPVIGDVDCIGDGVNPSYSPVSQFANVPLFGPTGVPVQSDVWQQRLADCYFLSVLAGVAGVHPEVIQRSVVDLGDGTFAVRLRDIDNGLLQYIRLDAQLPVHGNGAKVATFAKPDGSMWAPIMEKAWAWVRTGEHSYENIEGTEQDFDLGTPEEAYFALDMGYGLNVFDLEPQVTMLVKMRNWLLDGGIITASTFGSNTDLAGGHVYTVVDISTDLTKVTLRNPWHKDDDGLGDASNDGYITISAELFDEDVFLIWYGWVV